ncbi:MAG: lipoyl(octanoyl) transferase LipB [Bdellovibrionales bacterium]|nr:lipoyl(octanoyl) transferase LipB [Bdellovibrionales bacterium]
MDQHPKDWSDDINSDCSLGQDFKVLPIEVIDFGLEDFRIIWPLQREAQRGLIEGASGPKLFLGQHPPVITLGRSAKDHSLKVSQEHLRSKGIETIEIERGGDVTYHGPGQIVVYPIIDLRQRRTAVDWYMRSLEEVVLRTLKAFDIKGFRVQGRTGVWTEAVQYGRPPTAKKIASIGVRLSRWCTMHGFSLNITEEIHSGFELIHPCGMEGVEVTSLREEASREQQFTLSEGKAVIVSEFCNVFNYRRV